jgi:hypothetical protein
MRQATHRQWRARDLHVHDPARGGINQSQRPDHSLFGLASGTDDMQTVIELASASLHRLHRADGGAVRPSRGARCWKHGMAPAVANPAGGHPLLWRTKKGGPAEFVAATDRWRNST